MFKTFRAALRDEIRTITDSYVHTHCNLCLMRFCDRAEATAEMLKAPPTQECFCGRPGCQWARVKVA